MEISPRSGSLLRPMLSSPPNRAIPPALARPAANLLLRLGLPLALAGASAAHAQMSLSTAVDLALRGNPRVQSAQADVDKARAQLSQAIDAYVPVVSVGAGLGQAYGYSAQPPTLATVNAGSVVFNASQYSYVQSARAGVRSAQLAQADAREAVAQDTALAFITLDHDQQREQVVLQQAGFADTLTSIVQERVDAGKDSQIDLTQAKLTAAQLRLAAMKAQDDTSYDLEHLARLIGVPPAALVIDNNFPATPLPTDATQAASANGYANAAVASAFATAEARQLQASGAARFRFWPEFNLFVQYNRYATFTDSFATLEKLNTINGQTTLGADEAAFGVQISLPVLDKGRAAKARESAADAARTLHDAQNAQIEALDGASRLRHTIAELQAQADVATLQQQLAQQQLDVVRVQLQDGTGNPDAPQMTPKDEQKARIAERDKYLAVIDAGFQLRQAEIQLLRQTGDLENWLRSTVPAQPPAAPTPHP